MIIFVCGFSLSSSLLPPPCFCLWFIFVFARTCCFFNTSSESRVECIRSDTTAAANIKASSLPVRVAFFSRTTQLDCHDRGNVECRLDVYADTSLEAPPVSYACNSSLTFCRRERMDAWTWCCFSPPGYHFHCGRSLTPSESSSQPLIWSTTCTCTFLCFQVQQMPEALSSAVDLVLLGAITLRVILGLRCLFWIDCLTFWSKLLCIYDMYRRDLPSATLGTTMTYMYTCSLDWPKLSRSSGLGTERGRFRSLSPPVRPNRAPGLRWMRIHVHTCMYSAVVVTRDISASERTGEFGFLLA